MGEVKRRTICKSTSVIACVFWGLMIVAHIPALVSSWRGVLGSGTAPDHLIGCVVLSAAVLFFVLKLGGVAALRFRTGKRSVVAICLVVGLIHIGCLEPELQGSILAECTTALATTSLAAGLTQVPKTIRTAWARRQGTPRILSFPGRSQKAVWLDADRPRFWVLESGLFNLRAPPV